MRGAKQIYGAFVVEQRKFAIARRHGPPGTGKTLIARGIAKLLSDRKPILVRGPEVFSHLLGASEQAVRGLFKPADDEWARMGSQSSLHVVVLDECDTMLEQLDMRRDVQEIFRATPHEKQVMMFSATLSKDIRPVCKKFMQDPMEVSAIKSLRET